MKGIQEYVTYHDHYTKKRDLFCGNCFSLIKMNIEIKVYSIKKCPRCGEKNEYDKKDLVRNFNCRSYLRQHPIAYWARKYGLPLNSCYMAFRRRDIGTVKKGRGGPKLMSNREFLSGAVFIKEGRNLISRMIRKEKLLTDDEISNSIE